MNIKKSTLIALSGLIIGLLGVIGPILWDLYKNNSALLVELNEIGAVVDATNRPDGLNVVYKGKELKELYILKFIIKNSGNRPILKKDVVSPLSIKFQDSDKIVDVQPSSSKPDGIERHISYDSKLGLVLTDFDLLNPGDYFSIKVLTTSSNNNFDVKGRISGVKEISTSKSSEITQDESQKTFEKTAKKVGLTWSIAAYIIGFFSIITWLSSGASYLREIKIKKKLKEGIFSVPNKLSRGEVRNWVKYNFSFLADETLNVVYIVIDDLPDHNNFSKKNNDKIKSAIENVMFNFSSNLPTFITSFIISLVCLTIILW